MAVHHLLIWMTNPPPQIRQAWNQMSQWKKIIKYVIWPFLYSFRLMLVEIYVGDRTLH